MSHSQSKYFAFKFFLFHFDRILLIYVIQIDALSIFWESIIHLSILNIFFEWLFKTYVIFLFYMPKDLSSKGILIIFLDALLNNGFEIILGCPIVISMCILIFNDHDFLLLFWIQRFCLKHCRLLLRFLTWSLKVSVKLKLSQICIFIGFDIKLWFRFYLSPKTLPEFINFVFHCFIIAFDISGLFLDIWIYLWPYFVPFLKIVSSIILRALFVVIINGFWIKYRFLQFSNFYLLLMQCSSSGPLRWTKHFGYNMQFLIQI